MGSVFLWVMGGWMGGWWVGCEPGRKTKEPPGRWHRRSGERRYGGARLHEEEEGGRGTHPGDYAGRRPRSSTPNPLVIPSDVCRLLATHRVVQSRQTSARELGSGVGDPVAVEAEGHTTVEVDRGDGATGEVLRVQDRQVARLRRRIEGEAHHPAVVLGGRVVGRDEHGFVLPGGDATE